MKTTYETIVFIQGDGYDEAENIADAATAAEVGKDASGWPSLYRNCVEWTDALFEHLCQWDYGDPTESDENPPHGGGNDSAYYSATGLRVEQENDAAYILSWHTGLCYCALTRIVRKG